MFVKFISSRYTVLGEGEEVLLSKYQRDFFVVFFENDEIKILLFYCIPGIVSFPYVFVGWQNIKIFM